MLIHLQWQAERALICYYLIHQYISVQNSKKEDWLTPGSRDFYISLLSYLKEGREGWELPNVDTNHSRFNRSVGQVKH